VSRECDHPSRARRRIIGVAALLVLGVGVATRAPAAPGAGLRVIDNLYGTRFITAQEGWAVGAFGTIIRTRDGGTSWRPQVSHTVEHLYSVDFADPQHGWVVGRRGTVLHSDNGGETWGPQATGNEQHLFKVEALDAQHAWAVGDFGTILATRDGGRTWDNHSLTRDVILNSEAWPDATHGWIVGEAGTILSTSDGGTTWAEQSSGIEKTLFGVSFVDAQHGWAVGLDGLIIRTTDGGQTWQVQHGDTEVGALEQVGFREAFDNPSLYDIAVTTRIGYAVGDNGSVFASEDGGNTWHRKEVPSAANLRWIRAVSLVNGTHGALVGAQGLTIRAAGNQITIPAYEEHATEMVH
jgi:photosystem II stability/assembly factor-like uncharacterized protein